MFLTTNNTDTSNLEQAVNVSETKVVNSDIVFIVDSGATCHLINKQYKKFLININPVKQSINVAKSGVSVETKCQGDLLLHSQYGKIV